MTMTLVSTVNVGSGGAASIDFTSIPSATDLLLVLSLRSIYSGPVSQTDAYLKFNSDSGSNYSYRFLEGSGSAASSSSGSGIGSMFFGYVSTSGTGSTTNTFSSHNIYIPNHTSSAAKSVSIESVNEANATAAKADIVAGLWSGTAAITSIQIPAVGGGWAQYSTASLYTITKGSGGATMTPATPKATGGTISYSNGYFTHSFTSNGTFTPTSTLTADYLMIAGGGGGGGSASFSSGGGAGGVLTGSGVTFTSGTGYAAVIGSGGGPGDGTSAGGNTTFNSLTCYGGGQGRYSNGNGMSGGSGAGGPRNWSGGSGVSGQGYAGAAGSGTYVGGGGGAGGAGTNASGGTGGVGIQSSITGQSVYYAGGGGGYSNGTYGPMGTGSDNYGGGGQGYNGGGVNGVVIVRYAA